VSLVPLPAWPAQPSTTRSVSARLGIEGEALAPPAGGVLRSLGRARIRWVELEKNLQPPGPPEDMAIHRAIREAERLLHAGEPRQAMILSEVLALDLALSRWGRSTRRLIEDWYARFPSPSGQEVIKADLDEFDAVLNRLLEMPEYIAAQTWWDR